MTLLSIDELIDEIDRYNDYRPRMRDPWATSLRAIKAENERLRKALDDIAGGMVGAEMPSLDLPPFEFRAAMWGWSQRLARAALAGAQEGKE